MDNNARASKILRKYSPKDLVINGYLKDDIAAAIRDAEQRGMMRAAEMARSHGDFCIYEVNHGGSLVLRERANGAYHIAKAIERAAEIELLDDAKELGATDGEG